MADRDCPHGRGLVWWHPGGVTRRVVSAVFAGRQAELAVLAGALEDAAGGLPGVVLVGAEAGGGKARLGDEVAAGGGGRGAGVGRGGVGLGPGRGARWRG